MNSLSERVMGNNYISIATNMAIDGLYDRLPDKPKERIIPATLGDAVYFNVRTLFRNIWGSMISEYAANVSLYDYVDIIEQEMGNILNTLSEEKHPLVAIFYAPSYQNLSKEYSNADLKNVKTDKMSHKVLMENRVLAKLKQSDSLQIPIIFNDLDIKTGVPYKAFFVTHYPVDLLHTVGFNKTYLLESHTGIVKGPDKWYTKIGTKNLEGGERIPFNRATLQFFGDSSMFKSQPMSAKKRVAEVAQKYKWNQQTTKARMLDTLRLAGEGQLEMTLRKLW